MRERKPAAAVEQASSANGVMSRQFLETAAVVASWFVLNIAMASSTKWLFMYGRICEDEGLLSGAVAQAAAVALEFRGAGIDGIAAESKETCQSFKFPLTITIIHMAFSWMMCYVHIFLVRGGLKGGFMSFRNQLEKIAPLAGCFAMSVAMGNVSLKYIFPSFNQMLGAMSPLITVLMAVMIQQKRYNAWTWGSMPIICGGLILCSAAEVNFDLVGAFFCAGATILRAAKSIMQGKLLTDSNKLDSVTLLFYMAPWAALLLFGLAIFSEGYAPIALLMSGLRGARGVSNVMFLLVLSGLNACLLNVSNFLVTSYTSPVTLQVLGNVKSCLSIGVSVLIFRNDMTWEQAVGVFICLFGVWVYNQYGGVVKTKMGSDAGLEMAAIPTKDASAGAGKDRETGDVSTASHVGLSSHKTAAPAV